MNPETFSGDDVCRIFQELFGAYRVPAVSLGIDHRLIEKAHPGINDRYFEAVLEACGLDFMDGFDDDDPGTSVYAVPMDDPRRGEFRNWTKEWLAGLGSRYVAWEYTPATFCQEIEDLKREANKHHSAVLAPGMITLGISQKLIALYLKYLWLLGNAEKMPLFPPLDSRVFAAVGLKIAGGFKGIDNMQVLEDAWAKVDAYAGQQSMRSGTIWESRWWTDSEDEYAAE